MKTIYNPLLVFLCLIAVQLSAQKPKLYTQVYCMIGNNNFEDFPVKFGNSAPSFHNKLATIELEIGFKNNKNIFASSFSINSTRAGTVVSNNYAAYAGYAFQFKYGRILFDKNNFRCWPYLKLGLMDGTYIFTNDTNHVQSAISSGQTNEITLLLSNPKASLGLQINYLFKNEHSLSIILEASSGVFPGKIRTYSGMVVGNQSFTPNFFQLGLAYTMGL